MIYIRGDRKDYDDGAASGCDGWSYAEVLPYFRRAEGNDRPAGIYQGNDGPLPVTDVPYRHPLNKAFVRASQLNAFGRPLCDTPVSQPSAGCTRSRPQRQGRRSPKQPTFAPSQ
ncbi:hypothetical protein HFO33_35710 [Rhizobium leguminosarum]|nr:hypothetical protein [Rhizobium leguminosarum]